MNRAEILRRLKELPFDPAEYWLLAGGAMVLYGFREETADLDLGCSAALADRLERAGCLCRRTEDGKRVRQGMVFRGQGLNFNSIDGEIPGDTWLTIRSATELTKRQGIRTDLDLRSIQEAGKTKTSPLGESIRYIRNGGAAGAPHYKDIFTPAGMKTMAENFRVFCDRRNYPVYFHCVGGADRTGSLAFVLCGILGVSEKDLATGWEHRFYPDLPKDNPQNWRCYRHLTDGMLKYGKAGDPMKKRIELYLLACGVKPEEIERFRSIMLEK